MIGNKLRWTFPVIAVLPVMATDQKLVRCYVFLAYSVFFKYTSTASNSVRHVFSTLFIILVIRIELPGLFISTERALFPAPFFILELNEKSTVTALCYAHENLSSSQQKAPSLILGIAYRGKIF